MKRIIMMLTVALVMAAMIVASGMPAFAQDPQGQVEQGPVRCSLTGSSSRRVRLNRALNPDQPSPACSATRTTLHCRRAALPQSK